MTLLAYPDSNMEARLLNSERLNALSAEYSSSSDEEEVIMSPSKASGIGSSKMIEGARRILYSQESHIEEAKDENANIFTRTTIEVNGILVKRAQEESYKTKKSVRFNMDRIQLHEYSVESGDSFSSLSLDDGAFIANVLDAGDLLASDSELSEDDAPEEELTANQDGQFANFDKTKVVRDESDPMSSTDSFTLEDLTLPALPCNSKADSSNEDLAKEKEKLQNDILLLRAEYELEMKKLREEYQTRRDSYVKELGDLRHSIDNRIESSLNEERMKSYDNEKRTVDSLEAELEKRKNLCLEREEEIEEYEQYLDKRHSALNEKESDLNTLQEELEEFSKLLRKRDNDLKAKSIRIENEYNKELSIKACTHDEKDIKALRDKVRELQNSLLKSKIEVEKKEETCRELEIKVNTLQVEQKKLQGKVKNLESKMLLDQRINQAKEDCNQIRRTSVMALGSLASQRFSVEFRSPTLNHKPLSGTNSLRPLSPGRVQGSDLFLNEKDKGRINEAAESSSSDIKSDDGKRLIPEVTETRVDSRSVKSRTCIVM